MRVVRVGDAPESATAGMSGALLRSSEAMRAAGHDVVLLFREQLLSDRWPHRWRRFIVPLAVAARVARIHRAQPVDVAEVHEPVAAMYASVAATVWGRRHLPACVVLSHGLEERCWRATLRCRAALGRPTPLRSRLSVPVTLLPQARLGLRRASHVIVLNGRDREILVDDWGLPDDRVSVVPNGVEGSLLAIPRRAAGDGIRCLFLGSWLERKGVSELARAWPEVHRAYPGARLSLVGVGDAPAAQEFDVRCRSSLVVLPSISRAGLPDLLAAHDLLVLPSWFEGMPLAALEAAAGGLAVVATEIPGVVDIFRPPDPEHDGAILVGCTDHVALAAALCRVAADPALLARLQSAARRRAAELSWASSASASTTAYARAAIAGAR